MEEGQWQMKIINWLGYWGQLLLLPVYWLSFLVPGDRRLWLFGSSFGKRFADNPRYLYLYACRHKERLGIRPVWVTHNKGIASFLMRNGYEAYYYHSVKGILLALRAKVYFFDNYSKDINFWQSGGAVKINLWHGTGNKRINYDNRFDKVRHPKNLWEKWKYFPRRLSDEKPSHYVLASSDMMAGIFARAFRVSRNHVIIDGYPRNDVLLGKFPGMLYTNEEREAVKRIKRERDAGKKIILYMPTFRQSEAKFFEVMDLEVFSGFLIKNGYVFCTKLHPKSMLAERFAGVSYPGAIINIMPDVDTYCLLGLADMLATDYSSVYTDFLLLDRPTVFFTYDIEEYSRDTRDCYFEYDTYMPEARACDMEGFMAAIKESFSGNAKTVQYAEGRKKLCARMWKYTDGKSCLRILRKAAKLAGRKGNSWSIRDLVTRWRA